MTKPIELKKRHPAVIVLEALLEGQRLTSEGECYCLSEEYSFGVVRRVVEDYEKDPDGRETVFGSLSVQAFIHLCLSLPEETVIGLSFQSAVTKARTGRTKS